MASFNTVFGYRRDKGTADQRIAKRSLYATVIGTVVGVASLGVAVVALLLPRQDIDERAATQPSLISPPASSPSALEASTPPTQAAGGRSVPSPSTARSAQTSAAPSQLTLMEDAVTRLVNEERQRVGCGSVRSDERIRAAARAHSKDMAEQNYFSSISADGRKLSDRLAAAGYPREDALGENIAYGQLTAEEVVQSWMAKKESQDRILNCAAKAVGVGLAYRDDKTAYWTQDFGRS